MKRFSAKLSSRALFILIVLLITLLPSSASVFQDRMVRGNLDQVGSYGTFKLKNLGTCDITVSYLLTVSENTQADRILPCTIVLRPGEEKVILNVQRCDDNYAWKYYLRYYWRMGSPNVVHDDAVVYSLPYSSGSSCRIIQGYNGSFTHTNDSKFSLDWKMPAGTEVLACRDGVVVDAVDEYDGHGINDYYKSRNNLIRIRHRDGTIGEYCHFKKDGVIVNVGDRVRAGDLIGYSGDVGYSNCEHLHFDVSTPINGEHIKTFPVRFKTQNSPAEQLKAGECYTAP